MPARMIVGPGAALFAAVFAALGMTACRDPYPAADNKASVAGQQNATPERAEPAPAAQKSAARENAETAPLRARSDAFDLGQGPIRNPLNLYDVGIAGAPDYQTAGTVDGVAITMQDLQAQSVGAFSRIAETIYAARENGYQWLLERTALDKLAAAAGMPRMPFLLRQYGELPGPTDADIARILAEVPMATLPEGERRHAAASLWRLGAWEEMRRQLALGGRADIAFERVRQKITAAAYAQPDNVVARLENQPITRADLRVLAGYQAELARDEYWRVARLQFDKYVTRFLREREAGHLGITVDALLDLERKRLPPIGDADVRAFIADNPEYGRDAEGYERARDNVRRLRSIEAEKQLDSRLRSTADIHFALKQPETPRFHIEVPAPRWHGPAQARQVIVAFHSLGCDTCTRGSRLLLDILDSDAYKGRIKLLAGDYFGPGRLASYRGALALHCAPPEARDALLRALVRDFGTGEIAGLTARARAAGIDGERFRACLVDDTFLPLIVENLAMARRLGLERNVPGIFVNGVRIGELDDLAKVMEQVKQALLVEP